MIDLHTHSTFSYDGKNTLEDMVNKAVKMGLEYYGTSEHCDCDYLANNLFVEFLDIENYIKTATKIKEEKAKDIKYLIGVEFGFAEGNEVKRLYGEILQKYQFDYIINSTHLLGGVDCYYQKAYENKDRKELFEEYLKAILKSVKAEYDYDIIGHIGYITRYAPFTPPTLPYSEFSELYDEILKEIIARGKTLELNTKTKKEDILSSPNLEVAKRYYELGGRDITLGSDSHDVKTISYNFEKIITALKEIGFTYLVVYEKRRKIKVEI